MNNEAATAKIARRACRGCAGFENSAKVQLEKVLSRWKKAGSDSPEFAGKPVALSG
jgi:hypothetical protein